MARFDRLHKSKIDEYNDKYSQFNNIFYFNRLMTTGYFSKNIRHLFSFSEDDVIINRMPTTALSHSTNSIIRFFDEL